MNYLDISPENRELFVLFSRCNRTELYQIARRNGFAVQPNFSRDALIQVIIDEVAPPESKHDIDDWRRAIMQFLIDHRRMLETQITCPARSFEPDACFGCVDVQVVYCLTSNGPSNFKLIELRKKRTA